MNVVLHCSDVELDRKEEVGYYGILSLQYCRAHGPYTLVGPPSQRTGTRPPSCIYLDNHLYMNVQMYRSSLHNLPI